MNFPFSRRTMYFFGSKASSRSLPSFTAPRWGCGISRASLGPRFVSVIFNSNSDRSCASALEVFAPTTCFNTLGSVASHLIPVWIHILASSLAHNSLGYLVSHELLGLILKKGGHAHRAGAILLEEYVIVGETVPPPIFTKKGSYGITHFDFF